MDREELRRLPPGSKEAREQGCICPEFENRHGKGLTTGLYITLAICPVHLLPTPKERKP